MAPPRVTAEVPSWSGAAPKHVQQPLENAVTGTQAVVQELVGYPRPQSAHRGRGLHGELAHDIWVVVVDRGRDGHLVGLKNGRVVEARPLMVGQDLRGCGMVAQAAVVLEHRGIHVLAREVALGADLWRPRPCRAPTGGDTVRPYIKESLLRLGDDDEMELMEDDGDTEEFEAEPDAEEGTVSFSSFAESDGDDEDDEG